MSVLQRDMNESRTCDPKLSDRELVAEVIRLSAAESQSTAALISVLAEFDARRLYLGQGCSSMFTYCTHVLHLAEHAAYNRIEAARAARRFPIILDLLGEGRIHLSAVRLLAPHLTESNHRDVHASSKTVDRRRRRVLHIDTPRSSSFRTDSSSQCAERDVARVANRVVFCLLNLRRTP